MKIAESSKRPEKSAKSAQTAQKPRGRPRCFDADTALEAAMRVFSKNGYDGASLPALTRAMGINRPSLYAAFGNKEALFRKVVDRYTDRAGAMIREAMNEPTARRSVEKLLKTSLSSATKGNPRGCLLVQGALACSDSSDPIKRELASRRNGIETALRQRFARAIAENDLPKSTDPRALAKYVATFLHGIAVQLSGGASRESLVSAVDVALGVLPQ